MMTTATKKKEVVPFSLARGDDGLQRRKRGTVSKRDKGPRFHGSYRANESIDSHILSSFLGFPVEEICNGLWGPFGRL